MSLNIRRPGLLTTIQDVGRYGYQQTGMVVAGAMDMIALRLANLLVYNPEHTAALEITLQGPEILFERSSLIAIAGANLSARINGRPVGMCRAVYVTAGSLLSFGKPMSGCRAYLTVAGGLDVPQTLGSASTYLRGGIGGWQGRALQTDDIIPCGEISKKAALLIDQLKNKHGKGWAQASWMPDPRLYAKSDTAIRAMRGPEHTLFSADSQQGFWESEFQIMATSDRMGYRLEGKKLACQSSLSLLSTAVTFGTVQVPTDGNPIVLVADRQTTGGYPIIAQVATVDLPTLAQMPPGKKVTFTEISLEAAQKLYIQQEISIRQLKRSLAFK